MNNDSNDMDKLMREAAENYPLNINSADWNKVMHQLHPTVELPALEKKKNDYRYLYLLLLLPLGFICGRYVNNETIGVKQKVNTAQTNYQIKNRQTQLNQTSTAGQSSANKIEKPNTRSEKNSVVAPKNFFQHTAASAKTKHSFNLKHKHSFVVDTNYSASSVSKASALMRNNILNTSSNSYKISNEENDDDKKQNVALPQKHLIYDDIIIIQPTIAGSNQFISAYQTQDKIVQTHLIFPEKKTKTKHGNRFFYAGIVFGPDFSLVKNQKIKHTGSTIGVLAGLQITAKLAIETGAWWDKKNYYSAGEYFNTSKIPVPYNAKIISVDGSCNMIELPLNIRYTVLQKKKSAWFFSAGASSYLMKKEAYTYLYDRNNVQYNVSKSYKNSSKDWLSVMNISGGYQHQMGKASLRIEPYLKLPLKGVGIGKLPITSTGIYLSITYPLAK